MNQCTSPDESAVTGSVPGQTELRRGFSGFSAEFPDREIHTLEHADLSTFLHETGHCWLEELQADAARPDAPEQVKEDWERVRCYLGIHGEIGPAAREQWAAGAERYLTEGTTPSVELQGVFRRFTQWLRQMYCTMAVLGITLTDEVRGVMDRLVASDEAIARARDDAAQRPLFATATEAGMTPARFAAYREASGQVGEEARSQLIRHFLAELRSEQEPWWQAERAAFRDEATAALQAEPLYRALQEILKGRDFAGNATPGLKLDRAVLAARYGEESLKGLPKGSATEYLYACQGGAHPDLVAERYGFSSADEMIRSMMAVPPLGDLAAAAADARMKERHGDLLRDHRIGDEVLLAVHNDQWAEVLRDEITALRRKGGGDAAACAVPPVAAFREAARGQIGAKQVKAINPLLYLNGERKAAREAFDLNHKGDFNGAAAARSRQMLNLFLYAEAAAAHEQVAAILAAADRMADDAGPAALGPVGLPFREQMDALLERFGLAGAPRDDEPPPRESLQQFQERLQRDEGIDLPVPAVILDEQRGTASWQDLSMDELRAVSATLCMIGHVAGVVTTVRRDTDPVALDDAAQQLVERLEAAIPPGDAADVVLAFLDRISKHAPEADIPIIRPQALFERMDGYAASGPWHDYLWNPCSAATSHQNRVREALFPAIFALTGGIDRSRGPIYIQGLGDSLAKEEIVAMALNCGNERNLDLLLQGGIRLPHDSDTRKLSPDTLQEILGCLSADEIKLVNDVWRAIETLKPEMAALLRRQAGTKPAWIETAPLEIANGTLEGGLYPVAFDPCGSTAGDTWQDATLPARMFLKDDDAGQAGEGDAAPLCLDLESVAVRHLDRVVTWITHGEFAAQAKRLLKCRVVKEAIMDRLGEPAHKNLLGWVACTLDQDTLGRDTSDWLENTRRALSARTSTCIVGQKAADVVADIVTAASGAMRNLEVANVVRGSFEYLRDPEAVHCFAVKASEHMGHLDQEMDRTMGGALKELVGRDTVLADVQRWIVESRAGAAKVAAMMVWISGYREAQAKGLDALDAVRHADTALPMAWIAGRAGELSAGERTAKARELALTIGPAILRCNDAASAGRPNDGQGAAAATPANDAVAFLYGLVATGILKEALKDRQPDTDDPFLPWFLARLGQGLVDHIPQAGELAGHGEGKILGEALVTPAFEAGKAVLHTIGGKGGPATATGHYLHDLLTGTCSTRSPAMDILANRRRQQ